MRRINLISSTTLLLAATLLYAAGPTADRDEELQSALAAASSAQASGEFALAAAAYRKAVAIDSSIPELWANLGLMEQQVGEHVDAIQSFKQAIKMKPTLFVPQLCLGMEYLRTRNAKAALPYLKTAARLNANDLQAASSLGRAYSMLDLGGQAANAYLVAIQLAPNDGNTWLALGTSYLQQVEQDARLLNSIYKGSSYSKLRAAETFAEEGKLVDADAAFRNLLADSAPPPCAHAEYGMTLLHLERQEAARQQFDLEKQGRSHCEIDQKPSMDAGGISTFPSQPTIAVSDCSRPRTGSAGNSTETGKRRASCAYYSGDYAATSSAAQLLKTNPATIAEGLYWESRADQKLAVEALARSSELEPNSPQMLVLIGDVYRQKRQWSAAEVEYRKSLALEPGSRTARLSLAIVLFTELKSDEAFDTVKSILTEYPTDAEANLLAGEILVQRHDYEGAEPYLAKCNSLPNDQQSRLHVLRGQIYAETNRTAEAITEYRLGLSSDQDGSVHYQLARLYQKTGDSAAASEQIRVSKQLRAHWDHQAHVALEQQATDVSRQ